MWVGLSAKKVSDVGIDIPLQADTSTGKLVSEIETGFPGALFYRANLVKCLPLDASRKLRYPSLPEISACYPNLLVEIEETDPSIVFLLGAKVTQFVFSKMGLQVPTFSSYEYEPFKHHGRQYVPIHHPSYISVYKRKESDLYIQAVRDIIGKYVLPMDTGK
jgi:DNA polymerase